MSNPTVPGFPALEQLDADGAIQEAAGAVDGDTRAAFLRKAGVGVGAVVGASAFMGAVPKLAAGATLPKSDVAILNFALTLEYLEAAFYTEASGSGALSGTTKQFSDLVGSHERTHAKTLKTVLGSKAGSKPKFDFGDTTSNQAKFQQTAYALENTGVHAYLGQAAKIKSPAILTAAGTIVTVEARHAAAIALIVDPAGFRDGNPGITPQGAFDKPYSVKKVLRIVDKTGFIVG
jgi:ferritin-like protein